MSLNHSQLFMWKRVIGRGRGSTKLTQCFHNVTSCPFLGHKKTRRRKTPRLSRRVIVLFRMSHLRVARRWCRSSYTPLPELPRKKRQDRKKSFCCDNHRLCKKLGCLPQSGGCFSAGRWRTGRTLPLVWPTIYVLSWNALRRCHSDASGAIVNHCHDRALSV